VIAVDLQRNEQLTSILVECLGELVDGWGDLQSVQENALLSLELNVLGPLHESGQVALGWEIISNTKVSGSLFDKRVFGWSGGLHLLSTSFLSIVRSGLLRSRLLLCGLWLF